MVKRAAARNANEEKRRKMSRLGPEWQGDVPADAAGKIFDTERDGLQVFEEGVTDGGDVDEPEGLWELEVESELVEVVDALAPCSVPRCVQPPAKTARGNGTEAEHPIVDVESLLKQPAVIRAGPDCGRHSSRGSGQ